MRKFALVAALIGAASLAAFAASSSGLKKGERVTPFHPKHLAGPLAGTSNCFPCTFQNRPQVQVWVNGDAEPNVATLAKTLSTAMGTYKSKEFKALIVFLTDKNNAASVQTVVSAAAKKPELAGVGMAVIDKSDEAIGAYKINTAADTKNTVLVYKNWTVESSFVNLKADAMGVKQLQQAIAGVTK
jgi:hypothetical protein